LKRVGLKNSSMTKQPSSRLTSIDFLRGSAALAVVLHHAVNYREDLPSQASWFRLFYLIVDQGHLGVPLFFVISGFCIHLRWAKQYAQTNKETLDFTNFWKRRLHRLYPPYLVALCLTMTIVVVLYAVGEHLPIVDLYPEPRPRWMLIDFFAHLLMLHGLHPVLDRGGGNGVYWTLAREEYFYIMYFGLLAMRRRLGPISSLFSVLVLGVAFRFLMSPLFSSDSGWLTMINTSAIVLWIQWCLGMLAVEAHYGLVKLPRWCYAGWLIPLWIAAAILSARYSVLVLLTPCLWGMTFFTVLNYCVRLEVTGYWPTHWLIRWLSRVGIFSYSLYLIHNPVRGIMKQFLGPLAASNNLIIFFFNFVVLSVAGYFGGKLFFYLVESRFLNTRPASSLQPRFSRLNQLKRWMIRMNPGLVAFLKRQGG